MNVKLLKKIIKAIKQEPRRFDMDQWRNFHDPLAPCGTVACIGGYAVILSQQKRGQSWAHAACDTMYINIEHRASILLDLDEEEEQRLFYTGQWPLKFQEEIELHIIDTAKNRKARAAIAVKRIEHFIKTAGKE